MQNTLKLARSCVYCLLILFVACRPEIETKTKQYFDLSKFIEQQIAWLEQTQPKVRKSIANKKQKTLSIKRWKQELSLFIEADINRSRYIGEYKKQVIKSETAGARKEIYESQNADFPVKKLEIHYVPSGEIAHLQIEISQENYLYRTEKKLSLKCENGKLKYYEILGFQENVVGGKDHYQIKGEILL